jgi:metallo-beta-lactamase class B
MRFSTYIIILLVLFTGFNGNAQQTTQVYKSETLQIDQISPHTFVHISFLNTEDFGKVACNGMIVIDAGEALIYDTPANDEASLELINWLETDQKTKVSGVVATHFHWDCLGGLDAFHSKGISSYASEQTISSSKNVGYPVPEIGFMNKMNLKVGSLEVINQFFGEGHTEDNFVAYVPSEKILFGGCMIKSLGAGKGNLEDANVPAWPITVNNVKLAFPDTKLVIPGHGKIGGTDLLDYTIELFQSKL